MLGVSLQKLCFDYTVQNLGAFPPAVLSLLPLTIRQEMLPLMCVADVYHMEASGFTKGMDTSDLWKGFWMKYYHNAFTWSGKDWKDNFSFVLGYHAIHDLRRVPALGKVLFGAGCSMSFASSAGQLDGNSAYYFDQLMEIFDYMQFKCKILKLKLYKMRFKGLVQRHITAKLQGREAGNCKITKLCSCLKIFCGDCDFVKPVLEMLSSVDLQYIIHCACEGSLLDDIIPLMKQPLFKSLFISDENNVAFDKLWKLLDLYFVNVYAAEEFSFHGSDITGIDHSCKLRCSEGSCKSFLCITESREFYEWFFSNSLVLKHLKVYDTGTGVLTNLSNLDFQVQHLELNCAFSLPSAAIILSVRELHTLTLLNVDLSDLCTFLMSAIQSKLNLHFLSLKINCVDSSPSDYCWNMTQLFYLSFSFPELEVLEYNNKLDELLVDVLLVAWEHCGRRKLRKLAVRTFSGCNLEKLDNIAMVVTS